MSKRGLIIAALSLLLFSTGCSKVTTSPKSNAGTTRTESSIDYTQLSQSEKNEMTFKFVRHDVNGVSAVDLHIINRTGKNIIFQGNKFILLHPKGSDVNSTKTDVIKIKSNSTKTIKNLFEEVTDTAFQTIGLYCYKNKQNKLAYSEANSNEASSTNLKETTLQKAYQNAGKMKKKTTTKKTESTETKNKLPKAPDKPITSGSQAIAMVESQYGLAKNGTAYTIMKSGNDEVFGKSAGQNIYWVRLYRNTGTAVEYLDDWTVYAGGIVVHKSPGDLVDSNSSSTNNSNDSNSETTNNDQNNSSNQTNSNNESSSDSYNIDRGNN